MRELTHLFEDATDQYSQRCLDLSQSVKSVGGQIFEWCSSQETGDSFPKLFDLVQARKPGEEWEVLRQELEAAGSREHRSPAPSGQDSKPEPIQHLIENIALLEPSELYLFAEDEFDERGDDLTGSGLDRANTLVEWASQDGKLGLLVEGLSESSGQASHWLEVKSELVEAGLLDSQPVEMPDFRPNRENGAPQRQALRNLASGLAKVNDTTLARLVERTAKIPMTRITISSDTWENADRIVRHMREREQLGDLMVELEKEFRGASRWKKVRWELGEAEILPPSVPPDWQALARTQALQTPAGREAIKFFRDTLADLPSSNLEDLFQEVARVSADHISGGRSRRQTSHDQTEWLCQRELLRPFMKAALQLPNWHQRWSAAHQKLARAGVLEPDSDAQPGAEEPKLELTGDQRKALKEILTEGADPARLKEICLTRFAELPPDGSKQKFVAYGLVEKFRASWRLHLLVEAVVEEIPDAKRQLLEAGVNDADLPTTSLPQNPLRSL